MELAVHRKTLLQIDTGVSIGRLPVPAEVSDTALKRIGANLVCRLERHALGGPWPLGLLLAEEAIVTISVAVAVFAFRESSAHTFVAILRDALPCILARATVVQLNLLAGD